MVIIVGPLEGSATLLDFGPCVDLDISSTFGIDLVVSLSLPLFVWEIELGVKDKESWGGNWDIFGGRPDDIRSVGCSFTLRTAGLAVFFMLLLPGPKEG